MNQPIHSNRPPLHPVVLKDADERYKDEPGELARAEAYRFLDAWAPSGGGSEATPQEFRCLARRDRVENTRKTWRLPLPGPVPTNEVEMLQAQNAVLMDLRADYHDALVAARKDREAWRQRHDMAAYDHASKVADKDRRLRKLRENVHDCERELRDVKEQRGLLKDQVQELQEGRDASHQKVAALRAERNRLRETTRAARKILASEKRRRDDVASDSDSEMHPPVHRKLGGASAQQ